MDQLGLMCKSKESGSNNDAGNETRDNAGRIIGNIAAATLTDLFVC